MSLLEMSFYWSFAFSLFYQIFLRVVGWLVYLHSDFFSSSSIELYAVDDWNARAYKTYEDHSFYKSEQWKQCIAQA